MTKKEENQTIRRLENRLYSLEHENYKLKEWQDYYKGKAEALATVINAAESIHFRARTNDTTGRTSDDQIDHG